MNGTAPTIEIMAPFRAGLEWMKAMLFRPFDFAKWLTIAFAAFISGNFGGSGGNFRGLSRLGKGDWRYSASSQGDLPNFTPFIIAAIVGFVLIALVLGVILMWVSSRGKFIFTDCVVKNRGAISEPWREYRREGNSFFLFSLVVAAGMMVLIGITVIAIVVPLGGFSGDHTLSGGATAALVVVAIVFGLIWFALIVFWALVSHFMVPVMYRRRCLAREAFADVARLIFANPGPFILFVLFMIVLAVAVGIVGTMLACLTCCIGALPYISTVLLLPAIVWLAAFRLLFLRQFGDQYDVWAAVTPGSPTTLPPSPTAPA
jgi:MFS family permease